MRGGKILDKPLSYSTYSKGNQKVVFRYIVSVAICIILLGVTKIIINSQKDEMNVWEIKHHYYSHLYSKGNEVEPQLIEKIKNLDDVEGIYPYYNYYQAFQGFLSNIDSTTYFLERKGIVKIMEQLAPKYDTSRIPEENQFKAILSQRVVTNRKLQLGDMTIKDNQTTYQDTFESTLPIGFCPTTVEDNGYYYLILAKKGRVSQMNTAVRAMLPEGVYYEDLASVTKENMHGFSDLEHTFNIIMMVMTLVLSVTTGFLTYMHYLARRREVGILSAIGYSDSMLIKRMSKEILISTIIATILAILIISVIVKGLNIFLAKPNGYMLFKMDLSIIKLLIIVPLFMMIFSLIPTWILLRTTAQVTLVQRGY